MADEGPATLAQYGQLSKQDLGSGRHGRSHLDRYLQYLAGARTRIIPILQIRKLGPREAKAPRERKELPTANRRGHTLYKEPNCQEMVKGAS